MEAKGFNDRYQRFRDAGYEVVGVSIDQTAKNDEFRSECGLDFPLVSDEDASLTTELDLMKEYGEYGTFARRVTYRNSKGRRYESSVADIVMHVSMHGGYHRGQIARQLRAAGREPPYTDYIQFTRRDQER